MLIQWNKLIHNKEEVKWSICSYIPKVNKDCAAKWFRETSGEKTMMNKDWVIEGDLRNRKQRENKIDISFHGDKTRGLIEL